MKATSFIVASFFLTTTLCPVTIIGSTHKALGNASLTTLAPSLTMPRNFFKQFNGSKTLKGFDNTYNFLRAQETRETMLALHGVAPARRKSVDFADKKKVALFLVGIVFEGGNLSLLYSQSPITPFVGYFTLGDNKYLGVKDENGFRVMLDSVSAKQTKKDMIDRGESFREKKIITSFMPARVWGVDKKEVASKTLVSTEFSGKTLVDFDEISSIETLAEAETYVSTVFNNWGINKAMFASMLAVKKAAEESGFRQVPLRRNIDPARRSMLRMWPIYLGKYDSKPILVWASNPKQPLAGKLILDNLDKMGQPVLFSKQGDRFVQDNGKPYKGPSSMSLNKIKNLLAMAEKEIRGDQERALLAALTNDVFQFIDNELNPALRGLADELKEISIYARMFINTANPIPSQRITRQEFDDIAARWMKIRETRKQLREKYNELSQRIRSAGAAGNWMSNPLGHNMGNILAQINLEIEAEEQEVTPGNLGKILYNGYGLNNKVVPLFQNMYTETENAMLRALMDNQEFMDSLLANLGADGSMDNFWQGARVIAYQLQYYANEIEKHSSNRDLESAEKTYTQISKLYDGFIEGKNRLDAAEKDRNKQEALSHVTSSVLLDIQDALFSIKQVIKKVKGYSLRAGISELQRATLNFQRESAALATIARIRNGDLSFIPGDIIRQGGYSAYADQLVLQESI